MQGFESYTDSGVSQVGVHKTLCLLGTWYLGSWTLYRTTAVADIYSISFSVAIPTPECFFAVTAAGGSPMAALSYSIGSSSASVMIITNSGYSGLPTSVRIHLIGPATPGSSGVGLQTFSADGGLLFDSSYKPVRVAGVTYFNGSPLANSFPGTILAAPILKLPNGVSSTPFPPNYQSLIRAFTAGVRFDTDQVVYPGLVISDSQATGIPPFGSYQRGADPYLILAV